MAADQPGSTSRTVPNTVSMHFVVSAVARLDPQACLRVLDCAGIPSEMLAAPQARVSADAFAALWLAVAREMDDEFFGLDARRMKVGSFAMLARAVLASDTLERALRQILRGMSVLLDDIGGALELEADSAILRLHSRIEPAAARLFADETFLVLVHGLICWLTGQRITLTEVAFAHHRPAHAGEYTLMFSEHLRFDASATSVRFDARLLRAPVIQTNASLREFLRTAPQSVFLKYRNQDSWTARLRRRLRDDGGNGAEGVPEWPVLDDLAREFNVAPATLRRRLDAEGTSYQGIKDALRRDAAIEHLGNRALSIAEISRLLGFQEPSAFHRAFKRWNGVQPGEYRLRLARVSGVGPQDRLTQSP